MRILAIEDDQTISGLLRQGLGEIGYVVDVARDGDEGEKLIAGQSYDLFILDLMLPGRSGVEVCRALRDKGVRAPVLMLTALSSTADKVGGLEAGADDYLTKPFEFDELAARVKALLRRGQSGEPAQLRYADIELDLVKRAVTRGGQKVRLTGKEFALLEYLIRNAERVVTRTAIGNAVWEMDFDYGGNVIEVYISTLRKKLDRAGGPPIIHTVIGVGYTMNASSPLH